MQREDGSGRILLGDNTEGGHSHDAAVEVPLCWEFGFQLDSLVYRVFNDLWTLLQEVIS